MAIYTRQQLRDGVTASADLTTATTFTLVNNIPNVTYFVIEGTSYTLDSIPYYRQIFSSASVTSLVSCSMVTESMHAGFIVNPSSTATFSFTPSVTIPASHIRFVATNPTILSGSTSTTYGIELTTS